MKAELAKLLALYSEVEENGGSANLVLSTKGGKSIIKFTLESPPPDPATTAPTSPPAPGNQAAGRRRRNRGAAARACRNQRAATSQDSLAEVDPPPRLPPRRPLRHLLTPSPTSRRRRVMSLGRGETCPGGRGERERLFGSRKREGKLTITFPFYGKGMGMEKCYGKGRQI